jgi:26S proteasome regulatory subunit (ATPase 3-interacting protein)
MTGKASSEEDVVIDYLTAQNRPFNANDVFNNLHGQVGKTALTRVLAKLVDEGRIHGKCYGKQWVYVAKQVCGSPRFQT